jgi:hypothetical protein
MNSEPISMHSRLNWTRPHESLRPNHVTSTGFLACKYIPLLSSVLKEAGSNPEQIMGVDRDKGDDALKMIE